VNRGLLLYAPPEGQVPVEKVKGVGAKWAETLRKSRFEISSVQDLIQHYPRRHLDFTDTRSVNEVRIGDEVTIIGEVKKVNRPPPDRRRAPLKVEIHDGTSKIPLVFFNQRWREKQLPIGTLVAAKGKITKFGKIMQMVSPLIDVIKEAGEAVRIVPVYPATAEIHTARLRRFIRGALDEFTPLVDPLPDEVRRKLGLMSRTQAMRSYHFPEEMDEKWMARRRLVFDELFTLQVGLAYRKKRIESSSTGIEHPADAPMAEGFLSTLPFELTAAQQRSCKEIASDMSRPVPMHRLLQGEVGSGKTVVAVYAALIAISAGYQAAIMAPTEVLAGQHYLSITTLLDSISGHDSGTGRGQMGLFGRPEVVLLTGGMPAAKRREAQAKIADGTAGIVVGTHALIQEGVDFATLGLAVIDEQHRFGVHQRMVLKEKSQGELAPDVMIMTATPIPRTLTLTLYGDLDVSVLDELPKGRQPVTTRILSEHQRDGAYELIKDEVSKGRQAYVITPLIDESDKLEVKSAEAEAERLANVFPDLRVGLMHGRLRPRAKEEVMAEFRAGEIDVLISTTVVEVGVDVPNATVMVIEGGDRFGLSQLHQLRGRIGRGEHASTCLVFPGQQAGGALDEPSSAEDRLQAFASTNDGFELASKDLELRGSGTILGVRQAGWSDLKLTDLVRDTKILKSARDYAFGTVSEDPELAEHPLVRTEMEGRFADRLEWLFHS
jgi:ATP-dependent DNA helicase RecG